MVSTDPLVSVGNRSITYTCNTPLTKGTDHLPLSTTRSFLDVAIAVKLNCAAQAASDRFTDPSRPNLEVSRLAAHPGVLGLPRSTETEGLHLCDEESTFVITNSGNRHQRVIDMVPCGGGSSGVRLLPTRPGSSAAMSMNWIGQIGRILWPARLDRGCREWQSLERKCCMRDP